jgi:hypothetical protein
MFFSGFGHPCCRPSHLCWGSEKSNGTDLSIRMNLQQVMTSFAVSGSQRFVLIDSLLLVPADNACAHAAPAD